MKSNDNNINNPMHVTKIDMTTIKEAIMCSFKHELVDQDFYDRIRIHDPNTVYIIRGSKTHDMYLGDHLIKRDEYKPKYTLGITDNQQYEIYLNNIEDHFFGCENILIPICIYDNIQDAVNALHVYTKLGDHNALVFRIYEILIEYIYESLGLNETIIGLIATSGYDSDPRLQELNAIAIANQVQAHEKDIPKILRASIRTYVERSSNPLIKLYSTLYDIFASFNFFKGSEYQKSSPEDVDLREEINIILKVINNFPCY